MYAFLINGMECWLGNAGKKKNLLQRQKKTKQETEVKKFPEFCSQAATVCEALRKTTSVQNVLNNKDN